MRLRIGYNKAKQLRNKGLGLNMSSGVIALTIYISLRYKKNIVYNYTDSQFLESVSSDLKISKNKIKNIIKAGIKYGVLRRASGRYRNTGFVVSSQYQYGNPAVGKGNEYFVPKYSFFKGMDFESIQSVVKLLPLMLAALQRECAMKNSDCLRLMKDNRPVIVSEHDLDYAFSIIKGLTNMSNDTTYKAINRLKKLGIIKSERQTEFQYGVWRDKDYRDNCKSSNYTKCSNIGGGKFLTKDGFTHRTLPNLFSIIFNGEKAGKVPQKKERYYNSKYYATRVDNTVCTGGDFEDWQIEQFEAGVPWNLLTKEAYDKKDILHSKVSYNGTIVGNTVALIEEDSYGSMDNYRN